MKIAVIGCGIGGQAAALFLKRQGHEVEIFERFPEAKPVGAGLLLQPPGQAALDALDLFRDLAPKGARVDRLYARTANGRTVLDLSYADYRTDYCGLGIHRAHLFDALHKAVWDEAIPLHLHTPIIDIDNPTAPQLAAEHGHEYGPFDLVVIAEGSRSLLRKTFEPSGYDPIYPWGCLWTTCADPSGAFARMLSQLVQSARIMVGVLPIGLVPGHGDAQHVALFWSLPRDAYDGWRASGFAPWKSELHSLWPEAAPLLDQITDPNQLTFASYSDVVMRRWRHGHCIFIGDAAHGTSPQLGQGANLALVDAWTLASALAAEPDIDRALFLYEQTRRPHVNYYQLSSRWLTPFFQSNSRVLAAARDAVMGPFCRLPLFGDMMVQTLSGVRCWPYGLWQPPF